MIQRSQVFTKWKLIDKKLQLDKITELNKQSRQVGLLRTMTRCSKSLKSVSKIEKRQSVIKLLKKQYWAERHHLKWRLVWTFVAKKSNWLLDKDKWTIIKMWSSKCNMLRHTLIMNKKFAVLKIMVKVE